MSTPAIPLLRSEERAPVGVLLVSPNSGFRLHLRGKLLLPRWLLSEASSGADALEQLQSTRPEVLLLDPHLPDLLAHEFHSMVRDGFPFLEVLTVNAETGQMLFGTAALTPFAAQLTDLLHAARSTSLTALTVVSSLLPAHTGRHLEVHRSGLRGMIGNSAPMQRAYELTRMVAPGDTTVLVTGESGTGKDLIAQAIHMISPRQKQPFMVVNCAAIPEPLLEAELFGYAKGAFTGALQARIGRIHAAHGGTLFLDEIGDMPLSLQSKMLRFLEQGEVQRLGGNDNLKVDVRVIAATNADLRGLAQQHTFREDLYYRLAVFPIHLAPLRERMDDLADLALFFAEKFCPGVRLGIGAMDRLHTHSWPGNVRELRNVVERASILVEQAREILPSHILL